MIVLASCLAILLVIGIVESVLHSTRVARIPLRIHVNGTRGKSSVTRLIAAGLNAGGLRTVAKTTGSEARFILPGGEEQDVPRNGMTTILEQVWVIRRALKYKPQVLVIECMALKPSLQDVESRRIVRPQIGVISNVGPDHRDVMGSRLEKIAEALCKTIPIGGRLFTCEQAMFPILSRKAAARNTEIIKIESDRSLTYFPVHGFYEHTDNIATALSVCEHLGVSRETAISGMKSLTPDRGALWAGEFSLGGKNLTFINALAANDPAAVEKIWNFCRDVFDFAHNRLAVLVNSRRDRPLRSRELVDLLLTLEPDVDFYLFIGDMTKWLRNYAKKKGLKADKIHAIGVRQTDQILHRLEEILTDDMIVFGMGNLRGPGFALIEYVDHFGVRKEGDKYGTALPLSGDMT